MIYLFTINDDTVYSCIYDGHYFISDEKEIIHIAFGFDHFIVDIRDGKTHFEDIPSTDIKINIPPKKNWNIHKLYKIPENSRLEQDIKFQKILEGVLLNKILKSL